MCFVLRFCYALMLSVCFMIDFVEAWYRLFISLVLLTFGFACVNYLKVL